MSQREVASAAAEDRVALGRGADALLRPRSQPAHDVNLMAMVTLRDTFGLKTGFSDHTEGTTCSIAATALGAAIIEKHFTLDKTLPGPDHKASLDPDELATLVAGIRTAEAALGDGIKSPRASEIETAAVARKSLVALGDVAAGEVLSSSMLGAMRPGTGVSPMEYWEYLDTAAPRTLKKGDLI